MPADDVSSIMSLWDKVGAAHGLIELRCVSGGSGIVRGCVGPRRRRRRRSRERRHPPHHTKLIRTDGRRLTTGGNPAQSPGPGKRFCADRNHPLPRSFIFLVCTGDN